MCNRISIPHCSHSRRWICPRSRKRNQSCRIPRRHFYRNQVRKFVETKCQTLVHIPIIHLSHHLHLVLNQHLDLDLLLSQHHNRHLRNQYHKVEYFFVVSKLLNSSWDLCWTFLSDIQVAYTQKTVRVYLTLIQPLLNHMLLLDKHNSKGLFHCKWVVE